MNSASPSPSSPLFLFRRSPRELGYRVRAWAEQGMDLLFPPACVGCGELGYHLCDRCAQAVDPVRPPLCAHCGRLQPHAVDHCRLCRPQPGQTESAMDALDMARAAALFGEPLQGAIHELKYNGRRGLARPLARYLIAAFQSPTWQEIAPSLDAIVPVPLHRERMAERGFNQSQLLAEHLGAAVGLTMQPGWLMRHRSTRPQVGLDAMGRRQNVAGAFEAHPLVAGKALLLVDDVYTTGATLAACAQVARSAGATHIYALALALPAPDPRPGVQV